ncbi:MAG: PA14 domain-containing protein [Candidatus Brocadiia bacterium]
MLCAGAPVLAAEYVFPEDAKIIDVKRDFGAKGDGETDDTEAIWKAIVASLEGDYRNPPFIYLPEGTYLLSGSLKARITDKPEGQGGWSDGWRSGMALVGQSRERTILRLKDSCPGFGDRSKPKAVLITGSTGHGKGHDSRIGGWGNEAFQNYLLNFTVDVGSGNPGAIGVDFLASNRGAMDGITIRSSDPEKAGFCGIDMTRAWPGPALVKNVAVDGFDYGIRQRHMDCGMVFEHITLTGQRKLAIEARGSPTMSLRGVVSRNAVPVFRSVEGGRGMFMFLDSSFTYTGEGTGATAIYNADNLFLKNVQVEGYPTLVDNEGGKLREALRLDGGRGRVDQYFSRDPLRLFPGPERVPDLPIKETPVWHSTDLAQWANVADYGAYPRGTPREFTTQVAIERVDPKVDFGWGGGGPGKVGNDNFSIRWTGQIEPPTSGEYTFYVDLNDQARLWVDGKLIVDEWEGYHKGEYKGTAALQAGKRVLIKLEYWESGHDAWIRLAWSGPDVEKQIVPTEHLYPTTEAKKPGGLTAHYYGKGNPQCASAIQEAIDAGKPVVYVPNGRYAANGTIVLRGKVRKLIGMEADLKKATIRFDGGGPDTVFIEHLSGIHVVHNCANTLVIRRCSLAKYENTDQGTGDVFIEDIMGGHPRIHTPQNLWARQLNSEYGRIPQFINDGGKAWILGMKCESKMPLIINNGGIVECYALYSMTNPRPDRDTPMFVNNRGRMAVSFADGGQKSYWTKIKETRDGRTKVDQTWRRETMMYIGGSP